VNSSSAAVAIEAAFANVRWDPSGHFNYGLRLLLRETSGQSSATINRVIVGGPSGRDEFEYNEEFVIGPGPSGPIDSGPNACRISDMLRMPAHGELDTFYTDEGARWLVYCAPGASGNVAVPALYVTVIFRDDSGVIGSVGVPINDLR
jgi:hypothetical protein